MALPPKPELLISYKYNVPKEMFAPQPFNFLFWIPVAILILFLAVKTHLALAIPALIVALIYQGFQKSKSAVILLSSRYLIMGDQIVYFNSISKFHVKPAGSITITTNSGKVVLIEQSRFPTNARKDWKITKNQEGKFKKVHGKLNDLINKSTISLEKSPQ